MYTLGRPAEGAVVRTLGAKRDEGRQRFRDERLSTTDDDFGAFANVLQRVQEQGGVLVMGSREASPEPSAGYDNWQGYGGAKLPMHNLIIVEGLTGSGKSTMAHFISRQLWYQGVDADWVHEGETPHPVLADIDDGIETYMLKMLARWESYVAETRASGRVTIVEACFLNNLIETLFTHNVERDTIVQYALELEVAMQALNPALVYLVQPNVRQALQRNFRNRGKGFEDFVIQLATCTPYANTHRLEGYEGMIRFWQDFVALTDEIYRRLHIPKVRIDTYTQPWDRGNRQVTSFLSVPMKPDPRTPERTALKYLGTYKPEHGEKIYAVTWEPEHLIVNLFLDGRTPLIHKTGDVFYAQGWPFDICFAENKSGKVDSFSFQGKTVDYLPVTGTTATRQAPVQDRPLTPR